MEYTDRLVPVEWLAGECGTDIDIESLAQGEARAASVQARYGVLPTIGCEVEVTWSSLFPEEASEYFGTRNENGVFERTYAQLVYKDKLAIDALRRRHDQQLLPLYEATEIAGIPKGNDAYWEFAHAPAYSHKTLHSEVGLLIDCGLIPPDQNHSLHVTLGGLAPQRGGASLLLSGLELCYVTPERIRIATESTYGGGRRAWDRSGNEGIRERRPQELELGQETGTEFRSLELRGKEQSGGLLRSAQMLGASLLGYRLRTETSPPLLDSLADEWCIYRSIVHGVWEGYDLPARQWGSPRENADVWRIWADCLAKREDDSGDVYGAVIAIEQCVRRCEEITEQLAGEISLVPRDIMDA